MHIRYALFPHRKAWDKARLADDNTAWNEPLQAVYSMQSGMRPTNCSLLSFSGTGYRLSAVKECEGAILIRLFNAEGSPERQHLNFGFAVKSVEEIDLNGKVVRHIPLSKEGSRQRISLSLPRFGVKTFRCLPQSESTNE
jgi:alpha-mannosidase